MDKHSGERRYGRQQCDDAEPRLSLEHEDCGHRKSSQHGDNSSCHAKHALPRVVPDDGNLGCLTVCRLALSLCHDPVSQARQHFLVLRHHLRWRDRSSMQEGSLKLGADDSRGAGIGRLEHVLRLVGRVFKEFGLLILSQSGAAWPQAGSTRRATVLG